MVRNMKFVWMVVTVYMVLLSAVNAASVKAMVDSIEVVKGNPVTLRIKAVGGSAEFPKLVMIGDAPIVGQSSSSSRNLSMINGKVTSEQSTTKIIQFVPEQNMTIPAYSVKIEGKEYHTQPIDIKVVTASQQHSNTGGLFSLEMKSSKKSVMVGESFMVTVYFALRNDVRLVEDVQYKQPDLSDFISVQDKEQKAYIQGNYQVQEVRYIVTAQHEGNFTINPSTARVALPDRNRRDIFGMSFGAVWKQAISNTLQIEVLPQTQQSDLIGSYKIDVKIDKQEVKANKPVNLTVKIEGKGNLEGFEFPKYEIDGVTVYSDDAKIETRVVDGALYSTYMKSFAFISENDFSIPARTFTVLDTKDQKIKNLIVDAYTIEVDNPNATVKMEKKSKGVVQRQQLSKEHNEDVVEKRVELTNITWWMLFLAFISGMIVMYLFRFIPNLKSTSKHSYKESDALKVLYAHMSEDEAVEEMVRKLYAKKNGDRSVQIDKKELKEMVERFM